MAYKNLPKKEFYEKRRNKMKYWIKENGKWFIVSKEFFEGYNGKKVICSASYSNTTDVMLDELYEKQ